VDQSEGTLVLELVKGVDRFQASWDLAAGTCSVLRLGQDKPFDTKPSKLKPGAHRLRFANVDRRLTVWVDESLVFGDGVTYSPPESSPGVRLPELPTEADLKPAAIGVAGTGLTVRHLRLFRDTYYTVDPSRPDVHGNFLDPASWANEPLPVKTLYVQL